MQWPMEMATAMVMRSEQKQFRTTYLTSANMATELVPKDVGNGNRAYRTASRKTVERSRLRTHRSQGKIVCRRSKFRTELRVESLRDSDYDRESPLQCYRTTMAIDNQCDEAVDGATNFQKDADSRVRPV